MECVELGDTTSTDAKRAKDLKGKIKAPQIRQFAATLRLSLNSSPAAEMNQTALLKHVKDQLISHIDSMADVLKSPTARANPTAAAHMCYGEEFCNNVVHRLGRKRGIGEVDGTNPGTNYPIKKCGICGRNNHKTTDCLANKTCDHCHLKGHIQSKCRARVNKCKLCNVTGHFPKRCPNAHERAAPDAPNAGTAPAEAAAQGWGVNNNGK